MDGSIELDIERIRGSLRTVDHVLIRMTPVGVTERLLIDFRSNETTGPGVHMLPEVRSMAERLKTVEEARPGFPRPERIYIITWPLRVAALERLGVLEAIRERLAKADAFDALKQLEETFRRLLKLEREELQRAVTGEGYQTLWPPTPRP